MIELNKNTSSNDSEPEFEQSNFPNKKQEDYEYYIYNITNDITPKTYSDFQNYLYALDIKYNKYAPENIPEIILHIDTFGGSLHSAIQIYSLIKSSRFTISTYTSFGAFSQGALILLSGDERYMSEHSFILIHPFWGVTHGKYHEMKSSAEYNEKLMNKYVQIIKDSTRMEEKEIYNIMHNGQDVYYTQEEQLKLGIIDYIGTFSGAYFDTEYALDSNGNIIDFRKKENLGESVQSQKQKYRLSKFKKDKDTDKQSQEIVFHRKK